MTAVLEKMQLKQIDSGFYRLSACQARLLSVDGKLPEHGWEKRSLPPAELNQRVTRLFWPWHTTFPEWREVTRPIVSYAEGWITRTPLHWHDGKDVPSGWTWALYIYEPASPPIIHEPFKPYPPKPEHAELYQHNYRHEKPVELFDWQWSTTFGRWSRLVTFADGWHGYTYPQNSTPTHD